MTIRNVISIIVTAVVCVQMAAVLPDAALAQGLSQEEGFVEVSGGKVWYRIVGSGDATPLLLLHGGPGFPSYYLKPLASLSDERPVVFYDQLGAGRSPSPNDTTLWRIERFVEELAQLREALGLENVHILGHSWGTILALEYLLTKPSGVQSVIMASPAISIPRWLADADSLLTTLPDSIRSIITTHEADETYESPAYQDAVTAYYRLYLARKIPWSADIDSTFDRFNPDLYGYMWGPSEFTATGTLQHYEGSHRLSELELPVLFTTGRYDEAPPSTVEYYRSRVDGAEFAILEESAHMTMQDEPEEYVRIVRDFLRRLEGD